MHQLKLADNPASDVDATSPTSEQQPSELSNNSTSTSSPSPTESIESTLPGVKLPKTSTQYSNKSIKELKNKLKQLKLLGRNNQGFDNLIRSTSKELRAKLLSTKISKSGKSCGNIMSQLKRRFWWTCKRIFAQTENLKPLFNFASTKLDHNLAHSIKSR
ncbi:hypothetical protein HELRODRAFT_165000 [Helobdella robusta]|uniref:Uncharacterized protein n=1 Tax=Helobdella robusta TaxID=6412 RepID=T1EW36_HELRO|nr:hypothetical protein HELRODRAFT_165000 [Helobdella robusta]ESN92867.1 hypothetical protein HELRODRAFT_165000 [Helobdella robusta]